ncbi:hypothetical protein BGX21_003761 [Mortierella sp. AD011]|nr:hypothetical protein BGX20_003670 [Mortierella sp. AD010]KAF9375525.1 hypothetical protein BGX21_003761 [Mortierella sp. AD011]
MTFSIPQPIPSRSSHPVHAHQRPLIRRSHSSNSATVATAAFNTNNNTNKYGLSQLLATSDHHHRHRYLPIIDDDFNLANEDDEGQQRRPDSDISDDDNDDNDNISQVRNDSGHYSDLEMESENRGIPIGKPTFRYSQKDNEHLFGTAVGGSFDSKQGEDMQNARRFRYSHSHSNSDCHNSINQIADNLKTAHTEKTSAGDLILENTQKDPSVQQLAHFQYEQPEQLGLDQEDSYSNSSLASPSNISPCTPCAPTASSPSLSSSSPSPASITMPQRAQRRSEVLGSENISFQGGFEHNTDTTQAISKTSVISAKSNIELNTDSNSTNIKAHHHTQSHAHPNISIDTSKARLQNPPVSVANPIPQPASASTAPLKKPISTNNLQRPPRSDAQSLFGSKKDDKSTLSPPLSMSTPSNGSTRPLMMASQSRLSSSLLQQPTNGQDSQSSVLLPSLSPSSPRTNSALVNSLEQLSVSWKAPEHTPSFPINRLHRSRTTSSSTRPFINCSFSSNGTTSSTNSAGQYQNSFMSPNAMVTSSSYSSLPYSPAVAFLSNFVDVTAPRMAPDEEGEQVGDFIMGKMIGHGGFSIVREAFAIHLDGLVAQVAVKIVKTQTGATDNDRVQRMLDKEIAIWSRLSHPNVLPFVAVEKLPSDTFVFCELCTGGNLLDYLTRQEAPSYMSAGSGTTVGLEESQARAIFKQIAEAVRYLHEEKRIVHRDIKLENILQHEDGTWKICDFGLAEYQNDEAASYFGSPLSPTIYNPRASTNANDSRVSPSSVQSQGSLADNDGCFDGVAEEEEEEVVGGSLAYCSPEQLRSQKPLRCPSSDVWSLGVVLYALLTGRLPFQDEYEPRLQFQILNGRYEDPIQCSAEARDLLKNMFRSKPEDRWRIGEVIDSPWCMGTTLESSGDFGNTDSNNSNSHAKMNNFFSTFRF